MFSYAFNIQLILNIQRVILYSTSHSTFNYSFYIQFLIYPFNYLFNNFNHLFNIQLDSTIHSTLLRHILLVSDTDHCLLKTWQRWQRRHRAAAKMPATEIEAYEDDTRLHYDVESDFLRFLDSVLQRTDQIFQQHIVVVDQTVRCVCFVYPGVPRDSSSNINAYDKETLDNLSSAFSDV